MNDSSPSSIAPRSFGRNLPGSRRGAARTPPSNPGQGGKLPGASAGARVREWFCPFGGRCGDAETGAGGTPPEVAALDAGLGRGLRLAALVAGSLASLELFSSWAQGAVHPIHRGASAAVVVAAGVGFLIARRSDLAPGTARAIGGVLMMVGAGGFAATGVLGSGGSAWSAIWIALFSTLVPCSVSTTVGKSLVAAGMTPAVYLLLGAGGLPLPALAFGELTALFAPPFVAAGVAVGAARFLGGLGGELARAQEVGRYELLRPLRRGGMGEVWEARHRFLARPAAVKVIQPDGDRAPDARERGRFEREAQVTARLRSPHTVELYDFGVTDDGDFYYVMELLEGLDLEELVNAHGALPPARVVHLLAQALDSLAEAHEQGLLHRDVKPANLFVTRRGLENDYLKVLDFGLVKEQGPDGRFDVTRDDRISGTPAYLAPELVTGEGPVDGRSDLYSLGCVAYFLLTGRLVFEGKTPLQVAVAHATRAPVPPSVRLGRPIPDELEALVMSTLAKDPRDRPASARAMLLALQRMRSIPGWGQDDADAWWRDHAPDLGLAPAPPTLASGDDAPAAAVDRDHRPALH